MENIRVGQQLRLPLRFTVVDTIPQQLHSTLRGQVTGRRALTGDRNGPPRWRALPLTGDWPTERIPPVPVAGEVSVTGVLEHGDGLGTPGKDVVVDQFFLRHSGPWHYADQTELRAHPGRRDAYQHPPGPRRFPPAQWVTGCFRWPGVSRWPPATAPVMCWFPLHHVQSP